MAFLVQSESSAPKFRAEAFSFMLAFAAILAVWAIANTRFEVRRFTDTSADTTARNMLLSAVLLIVVGMVARLGWVTTEEAEVGGSIVKYSVRILWFLGFTAVVSWVLARTRFGSWTFAVGGNKEAARQVGVPAARTKTQLFMVVSAAAWLVGVLLAFRLNTIQASTGDGEEFEYIIAAVVGGTALTGGYGSTIGAGIGALIMAMAVQGIPSARWNSDWRFVFVGGILLLAVVANNYIRTKAESAR
jgi:simple sugar transport system permease protein